MNNISCMTADGLHSFSDGASNIIGLIGIAIASLPADSDHPYGHKKFETMFSLGLWVLLFLLSFYIISESVRRLFTPVTPTVDLTSFVVMAVTVVVNVIVITYERRQGKKLQSDILMADSLHTMVDILVSMSVIIGYFLSDWVSRCLTPSYRSGSPWQ